MARENQGLQIALIVTVMLTIILGVTTFIFYRQYDDANTKAKAAVDEKDKADRLATTKTEENSRLKKVLGFPETDELQAIDPKINEDMQTYAAAFPEDTRKYRQVVAQLYKALQEKSAALAASEAKVQTLTDEFKAREASKDPQIKQFEDGQKQASQDLAEERNKFDTDRQRAAAMESELTGELEKSKKDSAAELAKFQADKQAMETDFGKMNRQLVSTTKKLEDATKENPGPDAFDGHITRVDQHGTVWINVGRADALRRQTTFSVYAANTSDLKAGKKASIEVTHIVGDHLAQARITDDKPGDPIMSGDRIYTPLWSPGQQQHFALAGIMDVYGDGKNNQKLVHDLIVTSGGAVDCLADAKGELQGEITVNTRYLVLGDEPKIGTGKEVPASFAGHTKITQDAEKYRLQIIPLADLLRQMGWKNQTPVVRYGQGANPRDFQAKPETPDSRASSAAGSGAFTPRTPPQTGLGSAY